MNAKRIGLAWDRLFFAPERPTPIALFRILYGIIVIADLLLLRDDWFTWYGQRGLTSASVAAKLISARTLSTLIPFPRSDSGVESYYWFLFAAALCLTIGLFARLSAIVVFVALFILHHRNPTILNGADALIRILGFFLMFAPVGAAMSVDRLIRIYMGREGKELPLEMPWALRMIQCQISLLYVSTFWWKMTGKTWISGTAVYYALHLSEFRRFPLPDIESVWMFRALTWGTLAVELSMGLLVWFKEYRRWALLSGLCLHLSLEYAMNIPLFQWIVLVSYVTFLSPNDLATSWKYVRRWVSFLIDQTPSSWTSGGASLSVDPR
jgi:uncharacterized membrane protein YphA (DoxX/SURF4 family)